MYQPEQSPRNPSDPLDELSLPRRPIKPRDFLPEFREMVLLEMTTGPDGLSVEAARNVTLSLSKLARFIGAAEGLVYDAARESAACQALRDGLLVQATPPAAAGSYLERLLRGGCNAAQAFLNQLSEDPAVSSKDISVLVSRLRTFLATCRNVGWLELEEIRLRNPRARKLEWNDFPPFEEWRRLSEAEIAQGDKSRSYGVNQYSFVHTFLEGALARFGLALDRGVESAAIEQLQRDPQRFLAESNPPRSLLAALLGHGEQLFNEIVASAASDNRLSAVRCFYSALRDQFPGAFPESLAAVLQIPRGDPSARVPLFERFIEEHYHGETMRVVRKDLRVFGHYVAGRYGNRVNESAEKIDWRLTSEGKLVLTSGAVLGPITAALRAGAIDELRGFAEHLKAQGDLRLEYQRDLFQAAKRFLLWASEAGFVREKGEAIRAVTFDADASTARPSRRAGRKVARRRVDVGMKATAPVEEAPKLPPSPRSNVPLTRQFVIAEQGRLVRQLIDTPPNVLLGDLFAAHTRDLDLKRGTLTSRTVRHSSCALLGSALKGGLENHLERLRRSPFHRGDSSAYEGGIFVDNRGESILSCNVPAISRDIDVTRVQLGLNIAHTIFREAQGQVRPKQLKLPDVLGLDFEDVRLHRGEVTLRDGLGDSIGVTKLSSETASLLRTYVEIIRSSELGSLWASFNPRKPIFVAPDGYGLGDSLPGLASG